MWDDRAQHTATAQAPPAAGLAEGRHRPRRPRPWTRQQTVTVQGAPAAGPAEGRHRSGTPGRETRGTPPPPKAALPQDRQG
ncbi:hypothetical protein ACFW9L_25435 [Streptomyces sp. NPDC059517]|uniref:hypothetical protein n=1 Tax=Streptomyces sp. NPDC059517 TaxID=3346855 RepID=UPI0036A3C954